MCCLQGEMQLKNRYEVRGDVAVIYVQYKGEEMEGRDSGLRKTKADRIF